MNKAFNEKQLVVDLRQLGEAIGSETTYFAGPIFLNGTKFEVQSTDRDAGMFGDGGSFIFDWVSKRLVEEGVCTQEDVKDNWEADNGVTQVEDVCRPGEMTVVEWNGKMFDEVVKSKKPKPVKKDRYSKLLGLMTSSEFREWVANGGILSDEASGKAIEKLKQFGF